MAIQQLRGGVAYRKENGAIFCITPNYNNYTLRFADNADVVLVERGSLFTFDSMEVETIADVVSGTKGMSITTAYLRDIQVISTANYVGTVHSDADMNYILLANTDVRIYFQAEDLSKSLSIQNIAGKVVSFQGLRLVDYTLFATGIQSSTISISAATNNLLAKVHYFDTEEEPPILGLNIYFNSKTISAIYTITDGRTFEEDQMILVKADVKDNIQATVKEVLGTVDRRRGTVKECNNIDGHMACIVDESNVPITFKFKSALVEQSSLGKLVPGKKVSYNLKFSHPNLIISNIRIES